MKSWVRLVLSCIIFCIMLLLLVFHTNKAEIYAGIGSFYSGRNNYEKAQEYFEKSYNHGNIDINFRKMYVNSLVNSPLTIKAQERLVRIAQDNIKDSAYESADYFLRNLKKEINNKYPSNYIQQAPCNHEIMHWGRIPITYTFKNARAVPEELIIAVNDAFDTWERSSSARIKFKRVPTENADIIVKFNNYIYGKIEYGKKYVIADTVPYYTQKKLEKMVMELSIYDLEGVQYTANQLYNTALHEIFHALGFMGHSLEDNNIMYMTKDSESVINDTRKVLTDSDKLTLDLLYKIKPDITNADELEYKYIPYLILGDKENINDIKANEAKNYIRHAPNVPSGYIDYAQALLNEQNYASAILCLEKALRLAYNDKTKYLVYYNLAVAHYYDGSYELAHIYVDKAKEIKDELELHLINAEIYVKEKNTNAAIKEYILLCQNAPDNIDYAINLANLYISQRKYIKARNVLKEFVKNNPEERKNERFSSYKILFF